MIGFACLKQSSSIQIGPRDPSTTSGEKSAIQHYLWPFSSHLRTQRGGLPANLQVGKFHRDCNCVLSPLASLFHALAIKGEISSHSVRLDGCVAWPRWRSETHFSLRRPRRCRPGCEFGRDAHYLSFVSGFSISVEAQTTSITIRFLSLYRLRSQMICRKLG